VIRPEPCNKKPASGGFFHGQKLVKRPALGNTEPKGTNSQRLIELEGSAPHIEWLKCFASLKTVIETP
jgi:hypothetical protein